MSADSKRSMSANPLHAVPVQITAGWTECFHKICMGITGRESAKELSSSSGKEGKLGKRKGRRSIGIRGYDSGRSHKSAAFLAKTKGKKSTREI